MSGLIRIFIQVVYISVTASILALIILLVKKVFNKTLTPRWHYYIWALLLVRLLIPYYPQSTFSIYNLFYPAVEKTNLSKDITQNIITVNNSFSSNIFSKYAINDFFTSGNNNTTSNDIMNSTKNQQTKTALSVPNSLGSESSLNIYDEKYTFVLTLMATIWAIGSSLLLLYTLILNLIFVMKIKRYQPFNDERISNILESCKKSMNIHSSIPMVTSIGKRTPSLYGLINPKILLSEVCMKRLDDNEIRHIFLHELSHYKKKDIVINWAIVFLQTIHFFNPILWIAFHRLREDCEISCDEMALKYLDKSEYKDYGSTILKLLRLFSESNFIPITSGISKNKSSYKRRILMISNFKKSSWRSTFVSLLLILSVGIAGLTGCNTLAGMNSSDNTKALTVPGDDKKVSTDIETKASDNNTVVASSSTKTVSTISDTQVPAKNKSTSPDTPVDTNAVKQATSDTVSEVYKSANLGLSLVFPTNWIGKYTVKETTQGIYVYFKPKKYIADGVGLYFCILKKTKDFDGSHYDSINGKREVTVNDASYFLGGPTDIGFPDDNSEYNDFKKLQSQIPDIINSIKSLK